MQKTILFLGLLFGLAVVSHAAEVSLTLTDGSTMQGEILKHDDNGLQLRVGTDVYTNLAWGRFTQDSLKQLANDPKLRMLAEPFIEPEATQHAPKAEIKINDVKRLELPENPSVLGGLLKSSVGKFILLILFLANLYAAYEISIVKARAAAQVVGLSAVLPIIGPIIFLILPMQVAQIAETHADMPAPAGTQAAAAAAATANPLAEAAAPTNYQPEVKKVEPQIFARGKFTFNKRFIETKFASFIGGEPKGDATKFSMELKSGSGQFAVEYIAQVGAAEAIFETANGQVTVPFADIQEIKLNPKTA